jgi:F-box/WD-40 domain protein MET30
MVDGGAAARLQQVRGMPSPHVTRPHDRSQSIENLSPADQSAVNTVWSLFSSSRAAQRALILRGVLSICCPSQLSFLSEQLKAECRIDPFSLLPREVSIKCLGYLDAISLGRAAQVSRAWRNLADDDLLWRTICRQHIERKCEKCGWGLPLLEKKRRARSTQKHRQSVTTARATETTPPPCSPIPEVAAMALDAGPPSPRPPKRSRPEDLEAVGMDVDWPSSVRSRPSSRSASRPTSPTPAQLTKPWKSVYTERLVIERNWRKGSCAIQVLEGHTDAITCLQFDESLASPAFPVLMTGSWDRTVRIWNMETGACINILRGHQRGVRALQFDSTKLITGSMDATLKIWSWRTGECVRCALCCSNIPSHQTVDATA